ncbi:DNA-directed RNA polymerase mitochondrial precursor [Ophiobolus disseminans]|uniref:DNA-directed RNA polymerase n=1 Tax=Ophiobolus disseminans TaxID=1469910 RepID=A0A6A7A8H2_9PLEO|nr:DNA-directed RNA polymerase mitochondrial precursor [Ophiobolus disseminans]
MQAWGSRTQAPDLARLRPWDPVNPLVLHESLAEPSNVGKRNQPGVGLDPVELHQNLYACLRVGRVERASIILNRMSAIYQPEAPELVDAHNIYLQTLFELAQHDGKANSMATIEDWYRSNIELKGIPPNVQTFITLLRAAMNFLEDGALDEAVRKYMAMAQQQGEHIVDEINYSPDFTDEEWDVLIRAQPEAFEEPPQVHEVQEQLVNAPSVRKSLMEHGLPQNHTLKIKPVPQKGLGLDSLQQSLAIFEDAQRVAYPHDMQGTQEEKDQAYAYARQLRMEKDGLEASVDRWRQEDEKLQRMGIHGVMNTKPIQALMYNWYTGLVPLFKKHIEHCKTIMAAQDKENIKDPAQTYGPWLERCKPERLAALTISRAVASGIRGDRSDRAANKISSMSVRIGTDIMDYLNADAQVRRETFLKKQRKQMRMALINRLHKSTKTASVTPPVSEPEGYSAALYEKTQIPLEARTRLGALALELLMQTSTITVTAEDPKTGKTLTSNQAAFQHSVGYAQGKRTGWILPHHRLIAKLRTESVQHIQPVNLPMIVEPKPWSSFEDGGYYSIPQRVVRQKAGDPAQKAYAQSAIDNGDMSKVLAGLDVLGKVPWQINGEVLNVMAEVWNSGEGLGGIVPEESNLERPADPPADATNQERARYGKRLQEYENLKAGLHSQRCFQNFQLETARAFVNEKKIFFPHSVDFRGRAYPLPPILNHIGSDVARGLLKFAHGKELGTIGLQWLKIHLANLYGFDKASLKEREQFAMDNLGEIYDSANNPLDGRRWWTKAEDPWQCLSCCIELKNAFDSPDPARYMSQLPVHQDGTCNGLQHYAALGGDHAGARQVNLEPSDRPQDIYTGVAELVKEMVAKEAAEGLTLAKFINGHITRKVVKRTVMTNVYGVTFMGAKIQVEDELRALFPNFKETDKVKSLGSVALYVAYKIFEALGKIFNGAQEIQYWLGECGDRITTSLNKEQIKRIRARHEGLMVDYDPKFKVPKKVSQSERTKLNKELEAFKTSIIWTTPLKMPIVQPYRKDSTTKVMTKLQAITVVKRSPKDTVDKRKQLQAFPPNFIHSLDATHMTLSALKCSEMGLDFAAVHDSFWTHASDIPNLNIILRDAFVRMHSEDIVARLAEEFKARYAGAMYCASLFSTSKVGAEIRKWRRDLYRARGQTVSKETARSGRTTIEELAMEAKRQDLLNSEDPEEVKQGEEMVTPTSIWIENQDPKALTSYRLGLLGETKVRGKKNSSAAYDEMRDKVLDREAEVIAEMKHTTDEATEPTLTTESTLAIRPDVEPELDPAAESEPDAELDPEATTEPEPEVELDSNGEPKLKLPSRGTAAQARSKLGAGEHGTVQVWIPLTFPPVPQKGGWDVSRLRESQYFFS